MLSRLLILLNLSILLVFCHAEAGELGSTPFEKPRRVGPGNFNRVIGSIPMKPPANLRPVVRPSEELAEKPVIKPARAEVSDVMSTVVLNEGYAYIQMVVNEYRGDTFSRQSLCTMYQDRLHKNMNYEGFDCYSPYEGGRHFKMGRWGFEDFRSVEQLGLQSYRNRVDPEIFQKTYEAEIKTFSSLTKFGVKFKNDRAEDWSQIVYVHHEDLMCEARERRIECIWVPPKDRFRDIKGLTMG